MESSQPNLIGGFELMKERPPDSLLRRLFVTIRHFCGLVTGGGFAYVRFRQEQGTGDTLFVVLLRVLLLVAWLFVDRQLVSKPFPVQFRMRLELLGPTYIKLGQVLSLRQDLLPKEITDELLNLLDRLPVVSHERYIELIEADLGRPVNTMFTWIDPIPLGSASLGQTHRARLLSGEEVVLKVIKPGVRETIQTDTVLLRGLGNFLQFFLARYQPKRTIREFCNYTLREVDLRFEADNAETFAANFREKSAVHFPHVYRDFSSESVLCMEFFRGMKPNALTAAQMSVEQRATIIDLGIGSIVQMIYQDGFFHADLHPGNLIVFDNGEIGFIDLGMVGRLDERTRRVLLYYFYSLVMRDSENAARILSAMALRGPNSDPEGFRRELSDLNRRWLGTSRYDKISAAQLILQSIAVAGRYRIFYPEEIILMTKALVTVEGVATLFEPGLELTTAARSHVNQIILHEFNPQTLYRNVLLSAPEFLDVLLRSPMIFAQMLQQIERNTATSPPQPLSGLKEIMFAGFCVVAVAILIAAGAPWFIWLFLLFVAAFVAFKGLS